MLCRTCRVADFSFHAGSQNPIQRIGQDLEVVLHGPAVDSGIARNAGGVGDLGILARSDFEKSREGPQIAGQCLGLDFLNEVGLGIRAKVIPGILRGDRQGAGCRRAGPVPGRS